MQASARASHGPAVTFCLRASDAELRLLRWAHHVNSACFHGAGENCAPSLRCSRYHRHTHWLVVLPATRWCPSLLRFTTAASVPFSLIQVTPRFFFFKTVPLPSLLHGADTHTQPTAGLHHPPAASKGEECPTPASGPHRQVVGNWHYPRCQLALQNVVSSPHRGCQ